MNTNPIPLSNRPFPVPATVTRKTPLPSSTLPVGQTSSSWETTSLNPLTGTPNPQSPSTPKQVFGGTPVNRFAQPLTKEQLLSMSHEELQQLIQNGTLAPRGTESTSTQPNAFNNASIPPEFAYSSGRDAGATYEKVASISDQLNKQEILAAIGKQTEDQKIQAMEARLQQQIAANKPKEEKHNPLDPLGIFKGFKS